MNNGENVSSSSLTILPKEEMLLQSNRTSTGVPFPLCFQENTAVVLFQLAHLCFALAYLAPPVRHLVAWLQSFLALGHILLISWTWKTCHRVPSLLGWNIVLVVLSVIRLGYHLYRHRPVILAPEIDETYEKLFSAVGVPRKAFKRLIEQGKFHSLHPGEAYAVEKITNIDRLSLLIEGKVNVTAGNHVLHSIEPAEFLDSPEWESRSGRSTMGCVGLAMNGVVSDPKRHIYFPQSLRNPARKLSDPNRPFNDALFAKPPKESQFNVSLIAASQSKYLCWHQSTLEYFLAKEPYLAAVFDLVLARDITNKLYAMNDKVISDKNSNLDIRLPVLITSLTKHFETPTSNQIVIKSTGPNQAAPLVSTVSPLQMETAPKMLNSWHQAASVATTASIPLTDWSPMTTYSSNSTTAEAQVPLLAKDHNHGATQTSTTTLIR